MTPIEKNITVVDEFGNQYEATYPKRAKGLVKHGRARFIDEHTICLACPPNSYDLEDHIMSDTNKNEPAIHAASTPTQVSASVTSGSGAECSIPYILTQIAAIQNDTAYIHNALNSLMTVLTAVEPGRDVNIGPGSVMADDPRASAAEAVKHIVMSRETTSQQMLRIYERLLNHLLGEPAAPVQEATPFQSLQPPFSGSWTVRPPDEAATNTDEMKF